MRNINVLLRVSVALSMCCCAIVSAETVISTFGNKLGVPNDYAGGATSTNLYEEVITRGTYSPGGGWFDTTEPIFQNGGPEPIPDDKGLVFYMKGKPVSKPMNVVYGHEEAHFVFENLTPNHPFNLTVTVNDLDDFGLTWDPKGLEPAVETLAVYANGELIDFLQAVVGDGVNQLVVQTISNQVISDEDGRLELGFNFPFLWYPGEEPPPIGELNGARIEQIIIESPTTLRVDTAPVNTADWDPWWAQSMIDITNADFANMRSGMYPNSFLCDPYEEIMYYTGDQGHRSHWIYHVNDETIESLSGRFEVKWIIDWNGVLYTFHDGILAFDEDELGWSEPTNWVEENGSVIGSVAFAWQAMDNYAYPYDTDGNPFNEVDQADIDALRVDVLSAQTFVRGLIRFKPVDVLDWEMTSIDLDVVGSLPGDLNEDGIVGLTDLLVAIDQWGPCPDGCTADFNNDGVVNTTDIFVIFDYWGATTTRLDTTVKIPYVNVWR